MSRPPAEIGGFFASARKGSRVGTAVKPKQLGGVARLGKHKAANESVKPHRLFAREWVKWLHKQPHDLCRSVILFLAIAR